MKRTEPLDLCDSATQRELGVKFCTSLKPFGQTIFRELILDRSPNINGPCNKALRLTKMIEKIDHHMSTYLYPIRTVNTFLRGIATTEYIFANKGKIEQMLSRFITSDMNDFYATTYVCAHLKCTNIPKIIQAFDFLRWKSVLHAYCVENELHVKCVSMILMIELASILSFVEFVLKNNLQDVFQYYDECWYAADGYYWHDRTKEFSENFPNEPKVQDICKLAKKNSLVDVREIQKQVVNLIEKLTDRMKKVRSIKSSEVKLLNGIDMQCMMTSVTQYKIKDLRLHKYYFFHYKLIEYMLSENVIIEEADDEFEAVPEMIDLDCRIGLGRGFLTDVIEI